MSEDLPAAAEVDLRTVGLHKSYFRATEVPVLRGVDLELYRGEFVSITGASGSGKSTLLHLVGGLDVPDVGEIYWRGTRVDSQSNRFRDRFRNEIVGFIFQFYHLLPELSTLENVMLPEMIRLSVWSYFQQRKEIRRYASELLRHVGLGHRLEHRPSELSGGEMQRAAIARALVARPRLLLADEPTGNLDAQTGEAIVNLLLGLTKEINLTVLLVTHDENLAQRAHRRLRLTEGRLEDENGQSPRKLPVVA